jgi:hypothetical protein
MVCSSLREYSHERMSTATVRLAGRGRAGLQEFVDRFAWSETRKWVVRVAALHVLLIVSFVTLDPAQRESARVAGSELRSLGPSNLVFGVLLFPFGVLATALLSELLLRWLPSWLGDRVLGRTDGMRWGIGVSIALLPTLLYIASFLWSRGAVDTKYAPWVLTLVLALGIIESCVRWYLQRRHGLSAAVAAAWLVSLVQQCAWYAAGLLIVAVSR